MATKTWLDPHTEHFSMKFAILNDTHAGEIQKYADIINNYQKDIKNFC